MKADLNIRLVYSRASREKAQDANGVARNERKIRQMDLFADNDRIVVQFLAAGELPGQVFRTIIKEMVPQLILDTRVYPEFFSIFDSTKAALEEFKCLGIKYSMIPCVPRTDYKFSAEQLNRIRLLIEESRARTSSGKIIVISSSKNSLEKVSFNLRKFASQEISDVVFEDSIC